MKQLLAVQPKQTSRIIVGEEDCHNGSPLSAYPLLSQFVPATSLANGATRYVCNYIPNVLYARHFHPNLTEIFDMPSPFLRHLCRPFCSFADDIRIGCSVKLVPHPAVELCLCTPMYTYI